MTLKDSIKMSFLILFSWFKWQTGDVALHTIAKCVFKVLDTRVFLLKLKILVPYLRVTP